MIKLESREDGRFLTCSCLLCCVVTQRPRSTVTCYYRCCFCCASCQVLEPPDTEGAGTSPQSSLCPHWFGQQVFWKDPHPCSLVKSGVVLLLKRMGTTSQTTVAPAKQQERSRHQWSKARTLLRSEVNLHSPVGLAVSHRLGNEGLVSYH